MVVIVVAVTVAGMLLHFGLVFVTVVEWRWWSGGGGVAVVEWRWW